VLKSGAYGANRSCPSGLETSTAKYVQPEDRLIARLMRSLSFGSPQLPDDPDTLHLVMQRIIATGRCCWREIASPPLALGPRRSARLGWQLGENGQQSAAIVAIEGGAIALPCTAPWYVDPEARLAGPLGP